MAKIMGLGRRGVGKTKRPTVDKRRAGEEKDISMVPLGVAVVDEMEGVHQSLGGADAAEGTELAKPCGFPR